MIKLKASRRRLKKLVPISLLFLILANINFAQTTIKGKIKDARNPLSFVNIYAKKKNKEGIVSYTTSNANGDYNLIIKEPGIYIVKYSSLAYIPVEKKYKINDNIIGDTIHQNIILQKKEYNIKEVQINAKMPIVEKEDTVIFSKEYFSDGTEEVAEDVLDKIPGVNVSDNGNISVNGKSVETVMVEGDNLFGKKYKPLTKNLSADLIDEVEILKDYAENPLLKDIKTRKEVALNLSLYENQNSKLFGNADLGYGSKNSHDLNLNLISFLKNIKLYSLSSMNNIGEEVTGSIRELTTFQSYGQKSDKKIGATEKNRDIISVKPQKPPLKRERFNFNNTKFSSLNFIHNINSDFKIKGMISGTMDDLKRYKKSFRQYFLNTDSFNINRQNTFNQHIKEAYFSLDASYQPSKENFINYVGKYKNNQFVTQTERFHNSKELYENLKEFPELNDHFIEFTHKFNKHQILTFSGRYRSQIKHQDYRTDSCLFPTFFNYEVQPAFLKQIFINKMNYLGGELHYIQKMKKTNIELVLNTNQRKDNFNSLLKSGFGQDSIVESNYQNDINQEKENINLGIKLNPKIGNTLTSFVNLKMHFTKFKRKHIDPKTFTNRNYKYLIPKIGFKWNINEKNRLFSQYIYNARLINLSNSFHDYTLTDYRNLIRGTGKTDLLRSNMILANYSYGSWASRFLANLSFFYTLSNDYVSTKSKIYSDYIEKTKILLNNSQTYNINLSIDRYIDFISSNIKVNYTYLKRHSENIVNSSDKRKVTLTNSSIGTELRSAFDLFFNFHFGWEKTTNLINDKKTYRNKYFLDVNFQFSDECILEIMNDYYSFYGLEVDHNSVAFSDLAFRYEPKTNNLSFKFQIKNAFNNQYYRDINVNDIFSSTYSFDLLPRQILGSVSFRF